MGIKISINGNEKVTQEGKSILEVIEKDGIEVPTMCHLPGTEHFPTCMVCIVKDRQTDKLIPSCSTLIQEGMDIITDDEDVIEARKTALELLLSDHIGECAAPCQTGCPAFMDIPEMNRLLAEGKFDEALRVVKKDIALPAVLGRICPAPCERACRRRTIDDPVSICLLKRYAADHDLNQESTFIPELAPPNGKKIGIIGAGPAGLAAAYFLLQKGYKCTLYEKNPLPGGALRYAVPDERLPKHVLDEEIEIMDAVQQLARPSEAVLERLRVDTRYVHAGAAADFAGHGLLTHRSLPGHLQKSLNCVGFSRLMGRCSQPGRD